MTKLSQLQTDLINAAVADDGAQACPETAKTASSLIKRGFLISLPRPAAPSRLIVTAAGREAVGLPAEPPPVPKRGRTKAPAPKEELPAAAPAAKSKLGVVVGLLQRPQGASIDELTSATGWQAHSVRGAIAGSVKKKLGLSVTSTKSEAGRVYRIEEGVGA